MDYPKSVPDAGLVNGKFADENPLDGTPGSSIPASWGNAVTDEILSVIRSTNVVPAESNNAQLKDAIVSIADSRSPKAASTDAAGIVVLATQADAELGVDSSKSMSPLRVFQAISKNVAQSGESVSGLAKIATSVQTNSGVDDATIVTPKKMAGAIQGQALVAFTTSGTAPLFTLAPVPPVAAYTANQRFQVSFHSGGAGADTINISGLGARNLRQYDSVGNKVPAVIQGQVTDVVYDGTDFVVLDQLPNVFGVTPAQFDTSTKLATTAFVKGVGNQFSGSYVVATNTTLTSAYAGSLVVGSSSSAFTVTLPLSSTMPMGTSIKFWNYGLGGMSLIPSGSDAVSTPIGLSPLVIPWGVCLTFVSNGTSGWYVIDGIPKVAIQGSAKNLVGGATGLNAVATYSADEIIVENTISSYQALHSVSIAPSLVASGVNGLDTGTSAASTWYSVWVISNGTTTAGIFSLSATSPLLPAGYVYKARVGWVRTDASANKYPLSFIQTGRRVQYRVATGSNLTALPAIASATTAVTLWTALSVTPYVPSTAGAIDVGVICQSGGSTQVAMAYVVPNNAYSTTILASSPVAIGAGSYSTALTASRTLMPLESTSIYWGSLTSGGGTMGVYCAGWEDNL